MKHILGSKDFVYTSFYLSLIPFWICSDFNVIMFVSSYTVYTMYCIRRFKIVVYFNVFVSNTFFFFFWYLRKFPGGLSFKQFFMYMKPINMVVPSGNQNLTDNEFNYIRIVCERFIIIHILWCIHGFYPRVFFFFVNDSTNMFIWVQIETSQCYEHWTIHTQI